jgi:A nuclease family of the HNH/ENDO VII superfamily with conserved AHH
MGGSGIAGPASPSPAPSPKPTPASAGGDAVDALALQSDDGSETLDFSDDLFTDAEPGVAYLLSSSMPSGLTDPYAAQEGGWLVGQQSIDPFSGVAGPSGLLTPYVGGNVDAYTNAPAEGANGNAYTGGASADPMQGAQSLEELWRAYGGKSTDASQYLAYYTTASTNASDVALPGTTDTAAQANAVSGNSWTVDRNGWVFDSQGHLVYYVTPFANGGGYTIDPSDTSDRSAPRVFVFTEGTDIQVNPQVSPTTTTNDQLLNQAIRDAAGPPIPPDLSPPTSVNEVLAGTDWLPAGPPNDSPQPTSVSVPTEAPIGARPGQTSDPGRAGDPGRTSDDENLSAGGHGMWDSLVDLGNFLATGPRPQVPPGWLMPSPFDFLKFGRPAPTGNRRRDKALTENYLEGQLFAATVLAGAPLGLGGGATAAGAVDEAAIGGGAADDVTGLLAILEDEEGGGAGYEGLPERTDRIIEDPDELVGTDELDDRSLLAENLELNGEPRPNKYHEPHHIVPVNDPRGQRARDILEVHSNIRINDAQNGVWLPRTSRYSRAEVPGTEEPMITDSLTSHDSIHTNEYYNELTERLEEAIKADVVDNEMFLIKLEIQEDEFPY